MGVVAEGQEDVYYPERMSRFDGLESSRRYFHRRGMGMEQSIEKGDFIYDKIFLYEDERSDLKSFLEYTKGELEALDRGSHTYEVIQKGYTKATACRFIMESSGLIRKMPMFLVTAAMILPCFSLWNMQLQWGTMIRYWIHMQSL